MIKVINEFWTVGQYLYFRNLGQYGKKKTNTYEVLAKRNNFCLGTINWYARWVQYVFEPTSETIYTPKCLKDIAEFCETETKKHKAASRQNKKAASS